MSTPYRRCDTAEADIGMRYYLSGADGTGGRLKTEPEDFVVDEISVRPEPKESGKHVIATVTTRNWETNRLVRLLARNLGISKEKIGFAGTKDKRGITTQLMSFECPMEKMSLIDLKDVEIKDAYVGRRGLQIGDLVGNSFRIRVKECDASAEEIPGILDSVYTDIKKNGGFPNYFGVQRFGVVRPVTHRVGEWIVRGDFEKAVRCYLSAPSTFENEESAAARRELSERDDWKELLTIMPESLSFEKILVGHLSDRPGDWIGAIDQLPRNLQMMFVHAYQSYLFNMMLSERIGRGIPLNAPIVGDVVIPLDSNKIPLHENPIITTAANIDLVTRQVRAGRAFVTISLYGSDSTFADGEMGEIEREIIEKESIEGKDFVVPGLSHCSSKGSRREIICPVNNLSYEMEDVGYIVSFSLPKGNYATCLMREFMKSEMNRY
ncbi:MAG: tRNA pseudouridine(13) synthase TruD [Candidatus Methanoplasma sp.]|jgi:tRNA pseudouridine13 synthase|nr:tRNA pseudouridine(13) synthase TruD [Candidatus Methanoplasma sp.]